MDNTPNRAATAIRDVALESHIAGALHRLGWALIYRATAREGLDNFLLVNPDITVITAEDFLPKGSLLTARTLWIDHTLREHELQELLCQSRREPSQLSAPIPLLTSRVSVVSTVDSGVGGSTFAINLAYESVQSGRKTLLFDFNAPNPNLSQYFDLQRINRTLTPTRFGFTIGEVSDYAHLPEMARGAENFDHVIIDIGRVLDGEDLISGQRIHELLSRWAIQSSNIIYLLMRAEDQSFPRFIQKSEQFAALSSHSSSVCILISQSPSATRERRHLLDKALSLSGREACYLTRDGKNLAKAANERAPLAVAAPKCTLVREISLLYRVAVKDES